MKLKDYLRGLRCESSVHDAGSCDSIAFAENAAAEAGAAPYVLLVSGGAHECSSRSLALLAPAAILRVKNGHAALQTATERHEEAADPFALLSAAREGLTSSPAAALPGAIGGYIAYDAAHAIEVLPRTTDDRLALPDLLFIWPTRMLRCDHDSGLLREIRLEWQHGNSLLAPIPCDGSAATAGTVAEAGLSNGRGDAVLQRSFTRATYEEAVARVRQHIYDGDVYQVNLSQRFVFPLREEPHSLWQRLFAANPAPFYAYVDGGDHQVLSTSMERLLRIDADEEAERIETRPIKGTRPRGATAEEDEAHEEELRASEKDDAELSMIVDLARNDLGRVCRTGSVRVYDHRRVERYANVMHLVSVVEGRLRADADIAAVFRALFPGGSITGCPKIRAMEIIDEQEKAARHVYTGSVGLLEADGTADFNIAIRTAVVRDGLCHLSVGGGIVYDSDPAEEYMETLHKGATFFRLAGIDPRTAEED